MFWGDVDKKPKRNNDIDSEIEDIIDLIENFNKFSGSIEKKEIESKIIYLLQRTQSDIPRHQQVKKIQKQFTEICSNSSSKTQQNKKSSNLFKVNEAESWKIQKNLKQNQFCYSESLNNTEQKQRSFAVGAYGQDASSEQLQLQEEVIFEKKLSRAQESTLAIEKQIQLEKLYSVKQLEGEFKELQEMFHDLDGMVTDQQATLDKVTWNVDTAVPNVEKAVVEVKKGGNMNLSTGAFNIFSKLFK